MIVILCYQTWDMGAGGGVVNVILILIETQKLVRTIPTQVDSEPRVCKGYVFSFPFPKNLQ